MQPVMTPPNSGKIALREGAIVGVILAVVHTFLAALNVFVQAPGVSLIAIILIVIVWLVAFLFAGIRGSKQTGRVSTGTLAGLWTAIIAGVIALAINVVFAFLSADTTSVRAQQTVDQLMPSAHIVYTSGMVVGVSALYNTCFLLVGIGLGAGIGALGGLIGRSRAKLPPPYAYGYNYPPEMGYPPAQYPPQMPYPPAQYPPDATPNPPQQ